MFNTILMGWAHTDNTKIAVDRAEALLREMHDLFRVQKLDVQPNRRSYHFAMTAASKRRNAATRMKALFEQMKQDFHGGNKTARPAPLTYKFVSRSPSRGRKRL